MKVCSNLGSASIFAALLCGSGLAACAGSDEWEEQELGVDEQAFSTSASVTAVSAAEQAVVPFVSTVKYRVLSDCSGVKIPPLAGSSRVRILTAAHCLGERTTDRTITLSNARDGSSPASVTIPGGRTFVHPSFQLGDDGSQSLKTNMYDVAFFELASGATFAATPTAFTPIPPATALTAIGFGKTGSDCNTLNANKLKASITSGENTFADRITHYVVTTSNPTSCDGDSGGPLIFNTGANARVVGVVSGHGGTLTSYTRLQNVLEWINDPVDSTLASSTAALIANNSAVYLMNGALDSGGRPRVGCASQNGNTGVVSGTDVRIHPCDGPDGTYSGNSPGWRLVNTGGVAAGHFKVVNRRNGLCLGVNATPAALVNVAAFACATTGGTALDRQSWSFEEVAGLGSVAGSKAFRLKLRNTTGLCLGTKDANGVENDDVTLVSCSSILDPHKWYLTR